MGHQFSRVDIDIEEVENVTCRFFEHDEENILIVRLGGVCGEGSKGEDYGKFFYQKIGLALLSVQPNAVLVDMQDIEYTFGNGIHHLFQVFSDVKIFGDTPILTAFVLSEKNKDGLASLLQFDAENLQPPFYTDSDQAYDKLFAAYDMI